MRHLVHIVGGVTIIAALQCAAAAQASSPLNPVSITEWEVEADGRPRDPFASGPDTVWFAGQAGDYIGRLTPSTGSVEVLPLTDEPGPHNLVVGSDGVVWYAGNLDAYIGRLDPSTMVIDRIEMPDPAARDPHTLVFDAAEENIWFTVQTGNFVGRLSLGDRKVDLLPVPTPGARPYGVKVGADGTVWAALFGVNKLASVDPDTGALSEYAIPWDNARPRRLEIAEDGGVWYADYRRGSIGRFDPDAGDFEEWPLPSGSGSAPYGTALDSDGVLWVVETEPEPNRLIGFDTIEKKVISITEIPSGAGTVRHMHYYAPAGEVWFGTDAATIGRAKVGRR